jgi:hypothetical protein
MALTDENMVLPVQPMGYGNNNGGFGNGFFGGDGAWILLLLLLGWGGMGGFGMGGMMGAGMLGADMGFGIYPWMNQINQMNDGFRDVQLSDSINSVRDGVQGLSTQLCQCCGDMRYDLANSTNGIQNSIFGAQVAIGQQLNANEMASLNRSFAEQSANQQGFNGVQAQLAQNGFAQQAGTADLKYTIATENCQDRYEAAQNTQGIISAITAGIQSIKDDLCADRLDAERRENQNLRSELMYARGQASQVSQTADIINGTYTRLSQCPVNSVPVYGNQPIFTCPQSANSCGCGNNF